MRNPHDLWSRLNNEIIDCGFYPQLVIDSVQASVGDEAVEDYLVHHQATFAHNNVGRHLSVLVLTATRLIVSHTDESTEQPGASTAISSTESVPLRLVGVVTLTRSVFHPETFGNPGSQIAEIWLSLNWQVARRLDLEPAGCEDPTCTADHGYMGSSLAEDMVIRMSPAADGHDNVERLISFGTKLQHRVH